MELKEELELHCSKSWESEKLNLVHYPMKCHQVRFNFLNIDIFKHEWHYTFFKVIVLVIAFIVCNIKPIKNIPIHIICKYQLVSCILMIIVSLRRHLSYSCIFLHTNLSLNIKFHSNTNNELQLIVYVTKNK